MALVDRVPGMRPGATRRNVAVGLCYALVALLVLAMLVSNTNGSSGGGTVQVGVSTATNATPAEAWTATSPARH